MDTPETWHRTDQPMPREVADFLRTEPDVLAEVYEQIVDEVTADMVASGKTAFDVGQYLASLPSAELWGHFYFPRVLARMRRARVLTLH